MLLKMLWPGGKLLYQWYCWLLIFQNKASVLFLYIYTEIDFFLYAKCRTHNLICHDYQEEGSVLKISWRVPSLRKIPLTYKFKECVDRFLEKLRHKWANYKVETTFHYHIFMFLWLNIMMIEFEFGYIIKCLKALYDLIVRSFFDVFIMKYSSVHFQIIPLLCDA